MALFGSKKEKPGKAVTVPDLDQTMDQIIEDSPFLRAKGRYMDVFAGLASNAAQWRLSTFVLLLLLVFSVIGNIQQATNSRAVPYVVQVDEHGYAIPIQPADVSSINNRVVSSQIGQFITNMRIRVMDRMAQRHFSVTTYRSIAQNSDALRAADDYFRNNAPFDAKEPVTIEIRSVIPITQFTYQAEWTERTGVEASAANARRYQGVFDVEISPPTDVQNLINNPLGVYITDFRIQELLN